MSNESQYEIGQQNGFEKNKTAAGIFADATGGKRKRKGTKKFRLTKKKQTRSYR